jgi:hypothetical protein
MAISETTPNERPGWPLPPTPEQKIQAEIAILESGYREAASSPEKARAFLQRAGILDATGKLAAPYRD